MAQKPEAANWIWQEDDGPQNTWMCFRKSFEVPEVPTRAMTFISAESKYWLWINGELVVFEGQLKNSLRENTYYDVIDIAPYLVEGKNTIAALVWHFGKDGFSHRNTGKGGFLFEADLNSQKLISDATWKIKVHPGYEQSKGGGQPNMRMSESNIRFNAMKDISGWQNNAFDNTNWQTATVKGAASSAPWNELVKRPFPLFKDFGLKAFTNDKSIPHVSLGGLISATLPYNMRVSAYLKIKADSGQVINIQTDQYDGWYDFGEGPGLRSEYITKSGEQEFETLMWTTGNEVLYTIPEGVEIISLKYRELGFPAEFKGQFSCNDPFYDTLWSMARRTLYINMYDNFMDCPDRERALWWGDVVNQSGEVFYTLDTNAHGLIRKAIHTLVDWQRPDSSMFSPPSVLWSAELPQQILASIGWYGFWNYFMNTNDSTTIIEAYPAVRKYLALWKMNENGLVQHRRGAWDWADWGKNIDIEILDNCWYYLALKAAIPMAQMSGFDADTAEYARRMKSIEDHFVSEYWLAENQFFISEHLQIPDDRANAMAVNAGLVEPQHYAGILEVLNSQQFASPYMEKYVLEAMVKMDKADASLQRIKTRYSDMVNSEYNTLWEVWSGLKEGTINHGWNAPNTVLSQNIAGLSPTKPGWTEFEVMPRMGSLEQVTQVVPSVNGLISTKHEITADSYQITLVSPENTNAIVGIPKTKDWKTIKVNGDLIWKKGKPKSSHVEYLGEDSEYIRLRLGSGKWEIIADK